MRAWEFDGERLRLVNREPLEPSAGQVVVDVRAAGLCHSDLTVMGRPRGSHAFALPLVLGHEVAGVVSAVGGGVTDLREGDSVVVYGPWGCGSCRACLAGVENLCPQARNRGIFPPGLGADGGLAEQVLVPEARHVVPTGGLDPVQAAPLTDAGLTAYNAVRCSLSALPPGGVAVVIGVGGLGHLAVQLLGILAATTVVAVDRSEQARDLALRCGADLALDPGEDPVGTIAELTKLAGADVVFDFVGTDTTLASGARMLRPGGELVVVGLGPGALPVSIGSMAMGAVVRLAYWGGRGDLIDVLALARSGRLSVAVETVRLDDVPAAYERLREGALNGRLVVLPGMGS